MHSTILNLLDLTWKDVQIVGLSTDDGLAICMEFSCESTMCLKSCKLYSILNRPCSKKLKSSFEEGRS